MKQTTSVCLVGLSLQYVKQTSSVCLVGLSLQYVQCAWVGLSLQYVETNDISVSGWFFTRSTVCETDDISVSGGFFTRSTVCETNDISVSGGFVTPICKTNDISVWWGLSLQYGETNDISGVLWVCHYSMSQRHQCALVGLSLQYVKRHQCPGVGGLSLQYVKQTTSVCLVGFVTAVCENDINVWWVCHCSMWKTNIISVSVLCLSLRYVKQSTSVCHAGGFVTTVSETNTICVSQ